MNWAALEDRTNRRALSVFGSSQATPVKLGWVPVLGDLTEPGDEVFLDGVSAVATVPSFLMCSADVPDPVIHQPLHVGPRSFLVVDQRPDGHGFTRLMLEVAQ